MRSPVRALTGNKRRRFSLRSLLVILAIVPSLALVGLWGFTANHLWTQTTGLKDNNNVATRAGMPAYTLMLQFQAERRLSAGWLAAPDDAVKKALQEQRAKTDAAVTDFLHLIEGLNDTDAEVVAKAHRVERDRAALPAARARVDQRAGSRSELLRPFTAAVDTQLDTFAALSDIHADGELTYRAQSLVDMFRAAEMIAREDTLITYAEATRKLGPDEYLEFAQTVGTRRSLYEEQIAPYLERDQALIYQQLTNSPPWQVMTTAEDAVLAMGVRGSSSTRSGDGFTLPPEAASWRMAMDQLTGPLLAFDTNRAGEIVSSSQDTVDDLQWTVWLISASGLAVVVVVTVLCWAIARTLRRRLRGLQETTTEMATVRLPGVIDRLSRGEPVDTDAELPELPELATGRDEIGRVAAAFAVAQRAALDGAVRLAREREGHAKVFHSVALRTQSLVGRQLRALDAMENKHQDPEVLEDLFALDHLATRLRRYEENLVILSGHQPGRRWSKPVRVVDIVRSAVGEVEDFSRIDVHVSSELSLNGEAVGPVIHLLAELLENATTFSPPQTPVQVRGMAVAKGLAVEIEDRGLGMAEEDYAALNAELEKPKAFDMVALADDVRLGLFVVAQLAQRLGIGVTLRPSPYGGTLAIVFLPKELIVGGANTFDEPGAPASADEAGEAGGTGDGTAAPDHEAAVAEVVPVGAARSAGDKAPLAAVPDLGGHPDNEGRAAEADLAPVPGQTRDQRGPAAALNGHAGTERSVPDDAAHGGREAAPAEPGDRPKPLPRRVRQASLAEPLRERDGARAAADGNDDTRDRDLPTPQQAAATISAFQRASERARAAELTTETPTRDRP
ncbi:sensor histidine kinase [Yinghuangia seranimata]|uniref:sensor histidine kinase n=1 Tax=Yinghuangia seranimata TaxID=408067 RepID=UPI00248B2A02|nr:nitrate- and nitrite sensing domain-containing protein [Yinghuangia seranimata]MDI2132001.1 nitrate- and nitrite sensing domain-containing protein [Yinghuangia seranimata]